ncbi:MAG: hypothetical protein COB59_04195 [Rhodospirillaceae bacterium]|nr:MAG: hypothetical protein COB59_04195 [Rhodospirillaceae bacterium]
MASEDQGKRKEPLYALVDCNNFFASCERVFRPDLEGKPIVVLSNNDGCIVARSNEVKALDVPMAGPYFKSKALLERHGTTVFSSNYELYADMSARVMAVLADFSPSLEVYSIDEAFLNLGDFDENTLHQHLRKLQAQVKRWTGIPVSIGVAKTKTLAKLASERAKKDTCNQGLLILKEPADIQSALRRTPVGDVWGIGRRWSTRFQAMGITSAADFVGLSEPWVRGKMGVTGARTHAELLGQACFVLQSQPPSKKSCVASRSFSKPVTDYGELKDAIATFSARAAERLRKGGLVAAEVNAFVMTDRFKEDGRGQDGASTVALISPSNLTSDITRAALQALQKAYCPGTQYKKAGVMLLGLAPESQAQTTLFAAPVSAQKKAKRLQRALDILNGAKYGVRDLVRVGAFSGPIENPKNWHLRRDQRSPRYTTQWKDLKQIKD